VQAGIPPSEGGAFAQGIPHMAPFLHFSNS